jgi:hypothetical protein
VLCKFLVVVEGSEMTGESLSGPQVDRFIADGFVHLEGVVPTEVLAAGRRVIWADLGRSPDDPASWTEPVVRLLPSDVRPFASAFGTPRLHRAFDQLVGVGRWLPRPDLGLFVVRFPHGDDPGDTGWHLDSSFPPDDEATGTLDFSRWRVNVSSRGRALLMLFLFSDVGPDDGPTRIRVGSHLDVPPLLAPAGDDGMIGLQASVLAAEASVARPVVLATGNAGDVYLCHPFLVHGAQAVRSAVPRLMAQPPLAPRHPLVPDRPDAIASPVETAIGRALNGAV